LKAAKASIISVIRAIGGHAAWRRLNQRSRVTVLCYHDPEPHLFLAHVKALREHYHLISLTDFIRWHRGDLASLPEYPLIITMDDGHVGNFRLTDIINQERVPVTIFLCSRIVGTHRHYWWSRVSSEAERTQLKKLPNDVRLSRLADNWSYCPYAQYASPQALSLEQLQRMDSPWIDFQAHTRFHPILPRCTESQAREEILGCRSDLQESLKREICALAYPNGEYSERELNLVREAGFYCALTLDAGFNDRQTDPRRLKRIIMDDDVSTAELLVRASGVWDAIKRLLGIKPPFGFSETYHT
jgi:poly-beta-1,6-N-acetyl-D-glucosamine N-deacetylase